MKNRVYTFVVEHLYSKIIIEGNNETSFTLLVDHDVMDKISHSDIRIVFQDFKGVKKALYYEEKNKKYNLSHYVLGVSPRTRVEFRNNNSFDLRRENLLVNRRNIHF